MLISNKKFTNILSGQETTFLKGNATSRWKYEFDVTFTDTFVSTASNQVQIDSTTQLRLLGSNTWQQLGLIVGDSIDIAFIIGTTPTTLSTTVVSIQNEILIIADSLTSGVGELFPTQPENIFLAVKNNDFSVEAIDLFLNLVDNNSQGGIASLLDGEVNRLRFSGLDTLSTSGNVNGVQLGNRSGGQIISSKVTKTSALVYAVEIVFANWLNYTQIGNPNTIPTVFVGSDSIKPYVQLWGYTEANNPNAIIKKIDNFQLGNVGWLDENYNQGVNDFDFTIVYKDPDGNVIAAPDYSRPTTVEVNVSGAANFRTAVKASFWVEMLNENEIENNHFSRYQNIFLSQIINGTANAFGKGGAEIEIQNYAQTVGTNEIDITFDLVPNSNYTAYFDSRPNDRNFMLSVEVASVGMDNFTELLVGNGVMEIAPIIGGVNDELVSLDFFTHEMTLNDPPLATVQQSRIHDDLLVHGAFDFEIGGSYQSINLKVQVERLADNARFDLIQEPVNLGQFPNVNGVIVADFFKQLNTTLPSQGRNFVEVKQVSQGSGVYRINTKHTVIVDWRYWVSVNAAFVEFLNNRNQKWSNYDVTGYRINYRVEVVKDGVTFFNDAQIAAFDYDEPEAITTIELQQLNGTPIGVLPPNELVKVIATHTLTSGVWNQSRTWGYVQLQNFEGAAWRIISTAHDHTANNAPFQPLPNETRAKLTFPSADVAVVECLLNTNQLTDIQSITARIAQSEGCISGFTRLVEELDAEFGTTYADWKDGLDNIVSQISFRPTDMCCPPCEVFGTGLYVLASRDVAMGYWVNDFGNPEPCELKTYDEDADYKALIDRLNTEYFPSVSPTRIEGLNVRAYNKYLNDIEGLYIAIGNKFADEIQREEIIYNILSYGLSFQCDEGETGTDYQIIISL